MSKLKQLRELKTAHEKSSFHVNELAHAIEEIVEREDATDADLEEAISAYSDALKVAHHDSLELANFMTELGLG